MNQKKTSDSFLMKLALGAALAASAGYAYFTHKEEIDAEAKKRIGQLAKTFRQSKAVVEERAKKIWGEASKETIARYLDVRANLLHALESEQVKKGAEIAKKRYEEIVDMAIKKAQSAGLLKNKNDRKLAALLKGDWKEVQKTMLMGIGEAQKKVKDFIKNKPAKKIAQEGKKMTKNLMKNRTVKKTVKKGGKMAQSALKKNKKKVADVKKKVKKMIKK